MSADNVLFVMRRGTGFVALHLSASVEYDQRTLDRERPVVQADSLDQILLLAHREVERRYYEYGVSLAHGLTDEVTA